MLNGKYMTTNSITKTLAIKIIKIDEGYFSKPYHCSEGFLTIGWGRKISNTKNAPIPAITTTKKEEESYLNNLVDNILVQLETRFKRQWLNIGNTRKAVLVSMVYQLGWTGFLGFRNMILAIEGGDFNTASREMLNSKAAKQVPNRFRRNANMMLSDSLDSYYGD
jgi:lysozyme